MSKPFINWKKGVEKIKPMKKVVLTVWLKSQHWNSDNWICLSAASESQQRRETQK